VTLPPDDWPRLKDASAGARARPKDEHPAYLAATCAGRFAPGYLAFLSSKGGANGLWKVESGAVLKLWRGDEGAVVASPAISPDGRVICFSYRKTGQRACTVMNANGTNVAHW
jgi:hypothetical protein